MRIELRKLIQQAVVDEYFPTTIYPLSVTKKEIIYDSELSVGPDEFVINLKKNFLEEVPPRITIEVTEPRKFGDNIEFIAFEEKREKKSIKEKDESMKFPEIKLVPLRVIPSISKTIFIIRLHNKKIDIFGIGGSENFQKKTLNFLLRYVLRAAQGRNHQSKDFEFSMAGMYGILSGLAENVGYIKVNPRYNDAFVKIMAQEGEKVKIENIEYFILDIQFRGYKITRSLGLLDLLKQKGILIDEILGKWRFEKYPVTIWVRRDGRVTFYLSPKLGVDEKSARDLAIKYYSELVEIERKSEDSKISILTLDKFGV